MYEIAYAVSNTVCLEIVYMNLRYDSTVGSLGKFCVKTGVSFTSCTQLMSNLKYRMFSLSTFSFPIPRLCKKIWRRC